MNGEKRQRRIIGAKYFGRTIRAFRLSTGLTQEDLAKKAGIGPATVGEIERERGRLSEQTLVALCLGLESETGKPMLKAVYDWASVALLDELRAIEAQMRKDRGVAAPDFGEERSHEEQFERNLKDYLDAQRKLLSQVFQLGLGVVSFPLGIEFPLDEIPGPKARVRPPRPAERDSSRLKRDSREVRLQEPASRHESRHLRKSQTGP